MHPPLGIRPLDQPTDRRTLVSIGRVREIWRYPVKSMAGAELDGCRVGPRGIPGDRGWATRDGRWATPDEGAGELRGAKPLPKLMQCSARSRDPPEGANGGVPQVDITLP